MEKKSEQKNLLKGYILALTGGILWGFSGTCGEFIFNNNVVNSTWLTDIRLLIAGLLMSLVAIIIYKKDALLIFKNKKDTISLIIFGIFGMVFCQYTYLSSIEYNNAPTATVLQYVGPALILILSCIKSLKLPTIKEFFGIILAVLGIFLIATNGNINNMVLSKFGLFLGILSAFALVLYTLLPIRLIEKYGSIIVIGYGMFIGAIFLNLITKSWSISYNIDSSGIMALSAIIIFGTILSFVFYLSSIQYIGAVKASLLASVEPVSATLFSSIWLHTSISSIDLLGFACIIATVFLLTSNK